jgi:8-oxo-dGTP pyrophosphatase MutT (NUDIX family)
MIMKIKKCVGPVIYNNDGKIFLMKSPKWKKWIIPGGEIKKGETEEEALRREIHEELGIDIKNLQRIGKKIKFPSSDFKDEKTKFIFIDFFVEACSTDITPNEEISEWNWFTTDESLKLDLLDTTRELIEKFIKTKFKK